MDDVLKLALAAELARRCLLPPLRAFAVGKVGGGGGGGGDADDEGLGRDGAERREDDEWRPDENRTRSEGGQGGEGRRGSSPPRPNATAAIARRMSVPPPAVVASLASLAAVVILVLLLPRGVAYLVLPVALRLLPLLAGGRDGSGDPFGVSGGWGVGGGGSDRMAHARRVAYLPPVEQHYAFEQLNERYFRDWAAYARAHAANPLVVASSSSSSSSPPPPSKGGGGYAIVGSGVFKGGVATLLRSLLAGVSGGSPHTASTTTKGASYPSEYNNGTVIVLDMTRLDAQASGMEAVRDQISFLVHYLAHATTTTTTTTATEAAAGASPDRDDGHRRCGDVVASDSAVSFDATTADPASASASDSGDAADDSSDESPSSLAGPTTTAVEVIVLLESPGGGVSQYGLAASHLHRLRSCPNVRQMTVCVDTVAASGGYMMACMSSPGRLFCAPFAMVGSIGVIGQSLNIQKTLEGYGVRPYVFRGGKMKNPVGMVGDVTRDGVVAMQNMIDRVHDAFRGHVASARGGAFAEASGGGERTNSARSSTPIEGIMDRVANGDVFLGVEAIKLGLVDRLVTSDEYISERIRNGARVLKLINYRRPVGLSALFGGAPPPYHHRMHMSPPATGTDDGAVLVLKKLVHRVTSALLAWSEDGMAGGSVPIVSSRTTVGEFQNIY